MKEGTASLEEKAYFDRWYQSMQDEELKLSDTYKGKVDSIRDRMHEQILEQVAKDIPQKLSLKLKWLGIAAALLLVAFAALYLLKPFADFVDPKIATHSKEGQPIVPGMEGATLTLANGDKIDLSTVDTGRITLDGGLIISKLANGEIVYEQTEGVVNIDLKNTISTANGETYRVRLPDGTAVWLNTSSSLTFPLTFAANERKVELKGEAYFEVLSNVKAPFSVATDEQTIEVLGTHFNVSAYANEAISKTTLLEGKVKVLRDGESSILNVGQQASVNRDKAGINIAQADLEAVMSWKEGYFRFKNEDIKSVMLKIGRWYDIDVSFAGAVSGEKFNGTISRSKSIQEVLEMLEATKVVNFKIDGRRLTVME